MSYTMTVDMPERAKAYIMRQGPRFSNELNAIVLAVVQAKMQYEDLPAHNVFETLSSCPCDRKTFRQDESAKKAGDDVYDYLMSQSGWLPSDYRFDREEANAR